ncbi:phosphate-binding protein [Ornatilinea apprima]|uniref:Phosphate-binding protein n=1 Tax=Ornatilinea apprima TaxID=1134406 RepID=A0A0P6YC59_9CHLR|nr:PstS family phosphate ABC transporter substrate-binding protein [Ornatilinea apprima]KPL79573.1 phosphate-binding protein [Ornatilinea apprima]
MQRKFFMLTVLLVIASVVLAACGATPTAAPTAAAAVEAASPTAAAEQPTTVPTEPAVMEPVDDMLPAVDPLTVTGDVVSAGSSTVYPLAERMAARFQDEGYAGTITIDSIGSGAGYERFCVTGESDVANASRAIKSSEVESCKAIGREPIEFRVGTDALAVVVSKENTFAKNATMEELAMLFSDQAEKWSDVNPEWPSEPIQRFIPGTDSGTFDYFVEEVFDKNKEPHLNAANTQLSEDDNVLVKGVEGSPYAIGYFGYAYYAENADKLNVLSIEGVAPTAETVDDNSYPLARPLFIYSDAKIMQDKPQVAAYINFFLTYVNEEISEVGYFPASEAALKAAKQAWLDAMAADLTATALKLPAVDPLTVTGDVVSAGSSTVYPLAERMAARFQDEGYAGTITIDSIGSGAGYERFCVTGESDVANASRAIKSSEVESCKAIGREPIEFRVGTDALAVVVSKENTFAKNATMEELAMLFSDQAEKWSDVNPEWPSEPIQRFIPGTDSGTFDYFVEEVFDKNKEPHLNAANTQLSEDDNVLVKGVEGSPYAIGYFGYAYYAENADKLNVLSIEGVAPTAETVDDNSYPLARPLFIYSDAKIMQDKPQVAAYINFFLTYVNEEISEVGYFPASEAALKAAKQAWLDASK